MSPRRLRLAVVSVVVLPLLGYPLAVLAGGAPSFRTLARCSSPASPGERAELELVYGRFATEGEAVELRDQVVRVGFVGTEVRPDGCGSWKVVYDGVPDYATGVAVVEEARTVGFDPRLEIAPG